MGILCTILLNVHSRTCTDLYWNFFIIDRLRAKNKLAHVFETQCSFICLSAFLLCLSVCVSASVCMCLRLCVSGYVCVHVCRVECTVDDRLYMTHQLLAAVATENVYNETKDALNQNKTRSWLSGVVDWLLALKSRFLSHLILTWWQLMVAVVDLSKSDVCQCFHCLWGGHNVCLSLFEIHVSWENLKFDIGHAEMHQKLLIAQISACTVPSIKTPLLAHTPNNVFD